MNSFQQTFQHLVDATNVLADGSTPPPPPLHPAPTLTPAPSPPSPPPNPTSPLQNSDLSFVPRKKRGSSNAVLAGHRYCLDRKRGEKEYWKCTCFKDGCRARIITEGRQLMTLTAPSHSHDIQHSEILVHITKQNLKRKAFESDASTRHVVLDSTDHLRDEDGLQAFLPIKEGSKNKSGCPRLPLLSYFPRRTLHPSPLPSDIYWGTSPPVGQRILHC